MSFSCAAPATWNSLPPAVVNCDTLSIFKSRLKTHLFNIAYSWLTCSASASEATALWRSTNVLLLLLLLYSRIVMVKTRRHFAEVWVILSSSCYCSVSASLAEWFEQHVYLFCRLVFFQYRLIGRWNCKLLMESLVVWSIFMQGLLQ